jgi:hypothetical protein
VAVETGPGLRSTENIAALIRGYCAPLTVAEHERTHGLTKGALGNYVKQSTAPARMPLTEKIQTIAEWLGAPIREVSRAFAADFDLPLYDDEPPSESETRILNMYRSLPSNMQALACKMMDAFVVAAFPPDSPSSASAEDELLRSPQRM